MCVHILTPTNGATCRARENETRWTSKSTHGLCEMAKSMRNIVNEGKNHSNWKRNIFSRKGQKNWCLFIPLHTHAIHIQWYDSGLRFTGAHCRPFLRSHANSFMTYMSNYDAAAAATASQTQHIPFTRLRFERRPVVSTLRVNAVSRLSASHVCLRKRSFVERFISVCILLPCVALRNVSKNTHTNTFTNPQSCEKMKFILRATAERMHSTCTIVVVVDGVHRDKLVSCVLFPRSPHILCAVWFNRRGAMASKTFLAKKNRTQFAVQWCE